jgi:hypothetical protein
MGQEDARRSQDEESNIGIRMTMPTNNKCSYWNKST